jgi:hypothetical protein
VTCYHCPEKEATRNIGELPMCLDCYVIALEHCADFTCSLIERPLLPPAAIERMRKIKKKLDDEKAAAREVRHSLEDPKTPSG